MHSFYFRTRKPRPGFTNTALGGSIAIGQVRPTHSFRFGSSIAPSALQTPLTVGG